jgi:hypothetical protein
MSTKSHLNPYEYDSRMVDWNLKNKFITKEKLKNFIDSLPDDKDNTELIEIEVDNLVEGGPGSDQLLSSN